MKVMNARLVTTASKINWIWPIVAHLLRLRRVPAMTAPKWISVIEPQLIDDWANRPEYVAPVGENVAVIERADMPCGPCQNRCTHETYQACLSGVARMYRDRSGLEGGFIVEHSDHVRRANPTDDHHSHRGCGVAMLRLVRVAGAVLETPACSRPA
jgi:hypothetical protein